MEHARWAVHAGVDSIGLNFYPPSPRVIDVKLAQAIIAEVSPFVSVVGVFANQQAHEITNITRQVQLELLQFHGDETPQFCESFNRPWLKGIRMHPELALGESMQRFSAARGVLVDSWKAGILGGTGSAFDWQRLQGIEKNKLILAGGLDAGNVKQAVSAIQPAAIDVASGVETEPGVKSKALIDEFVSLARAAH